jgi:hypothetical protein
MSTNCLPVIVTSEQLVRWIFSDGILLKNGTNQESDDEGINVCVFVGVKVNVGVDVFVSVNVSVGVDVFVEVGVSVGPNSCPGPQAESNKLKKRNKEIKI